MLIKALCMYKGMSMAIHTCNTVQCHFGRESFLRDSPGTYSTISFEIMYLITKTCILRGLEGLLFAHFGNDHKRKANI